jgi:outer membrane protein
MRITLLATLITSAFLAFDAQAVDLLQVYKEALANDPVFASARSTLTAGEERVVQGRAGLLPVIGVGGSYNRSNTDLSSLGVDSARNGTTNGYTISLSQPLFRWANWETYQQGKLQVAASEAQFAQAEQDLITRVAQAYFDVLAAQDALASVQAQKVAITEQLASAKRNFEVGTATITDTHEAQARFDLAVAQEFAAQNDLEIRRAALQQIIGRPAGDLAALKPGLKLEAPQPAAIDQWVQSAETQNYGVVGQQLALEIAQREVKKTRAGHYPTLDLVASRSHNNQNGGSATTPVGVLTDNSSVGVQWNIPIFSGFAVTSRVRETIALEERTRADLENARRTAAQGARQSYLGVNNGLAQVRALEAAEVSSQSALESNRLGYQVGVRINIDVLNAQQQLYVTRRDLSKARYDTMVNSLRLKAAAGSLKEEDLVQVNSLLTEAPAAKPSLQPAPSDPAKTPAQPPSSAVEKEILDTVDKWARAWSARDADAYLAFYSSDFKAANGKPRSAWVAQRRARIAGAKKIDVKVEAPAVAMAGDTATVKFRQRYTSGKVRSEDSKVLSLVRQDGAWKIARETQG